MPPPPLDQRLLAQLESMPAGARRTAAQLRNGLAVPEPQVAVEDALARLAAEHRAVRHAVRGGKREHVTWSLP